MSATCSVPDCGRQVLCKSLCQRHYYYQWRYGSPTPSRPKGVHNDLTGRRFGALVAVAFVLGRASWLCRCDCGQDTTVPTQDLTAGNTASCGCRRVIRRDGSVSYTAAHDRLTIDLGRAADQECADCGKPAAHWSYDHTDPAELTDWRGHPYSLDTAHYAPRCYSCHRRLDHAAARRRRTG